MFVGLQPDGRLSIFERTFERCMGLGARNGTLWLASRNQLWRFENFVEMGLDPEGYDARFVPVTGYTTGDVDIHDVDMRADRSPVFVVTRFNAVATLAERGSFQVLWKPPFIDRIAAEDRCHLNGLAMDGNDLRYATCVGKSNVSDGWRDHRQSGGILIDIPTNETIVGGLSMPHSPRLYDGRLWMIQSGTGEFGTVDLNAGKFEPVCFLPGFARGLSFVGHHAVIGISLPRDNSSFNDLALNERLEQEGASPKCAICVVNLKTGDFEHQLTIEGAVSELYDVALLPNIIRPAALGFKSDEISHTIRPELSETLGADLDRS